MIWPRTSIGVCLLLLGCGGLLDVSDPTVIEESDITNPDGAELLRRDAIIALYDAVSWGALATGLATDELFIFPSRSRLESGAPLDRHSLDLRDHDPLRVLWATSGGSPYNLLQTARVAASHAVIWYLRHGIESQRAQLGEMYALRGYVTVALAEQVCPGFALHELDGVRPSYGMPLTTEGVLKHALANLDSAVAHATDSARIVNFAQVSRARALTALGRFEEAATAASVVPTSFSINGVYGISGHKTNFLSRITYNPTSDNTSVSDREGGNGLDFVSAGDPRVPVTWIGTAHDDVTELSAPTNYQDASAPISIASGLEARLIEAEADLRAGGTAWLSLLNDLRATQITPALEPLSDPGTDAERVDLLFRERAFWLFGTGHRLGDLRRLIAHYVRAADDVFPSGVHVTGAAYGNATSIPFIPVGEDRADTGVTGCTDR